MSFSQLIYVSTLQAHEEHGLKAILESSVRLNQLSGITGMLLYYKGGLLQVLEGDQAEVMDTYARICNDKRHCNITDFGISEVPHRRFGQWLMGFKHISDREITNFPMLTSIFSMATQSGATTVNSAIALEMLELFCTRRVWSVAAKLNKEARCN
jgi:hypothetical protein